MDSSWEICEKVVKADGTQGYCAAVPPKFVWQQIYQWKMMLWKLKLYLFFDGIRSLFRGEFLNFWECILIWYGYGIFQI